MNYERQKILIDIDDTLLKSSIEIIRELNTKNNTYKFLNDLKDYGYKSIDKNITQKEIKEMYGSDIFWENERFSSYAIDFIKKYEKIFDIVFVSYGDCENLNKKQAFISDMIICNGFNNVSFIGCDNTVAEGNKSKVLLSNVYLAIDNHSGHLEELNAPKKVLFKNFQDVYWNQVPVNSDWYVVNDFKEIEEMIDFDLMLKEKNILIG